MSWTRYTPLVVLCFAPCSNFAAELPSDNFQESSLDSCRWSVGTTSTSSISGTYQMKDGLLLISDGSKPVSLASVYSQYYAPGDFDFQVDYALDASWNQTIVPAGSNPFFQGGALQVYFDGQSSLTLFRIRTTSAEQLLVSGSVAGEAFASSMPSSDLTGTLRIRRSGTRIDFMSLSGSSWATVGSWIGLVRPAVFGLLSANVNARNSVSTTFRNFLVNSGNTSFQSYQLPATPLARPDFVPGFVSTDSLVWIVWGGASGYDPFSIMAANGIGRARIRATTVSVPILEHTPFSAWSRLPWDNSYWASLQVATQELLKAQSLGMQTYMELFLSDTAADAGTQNAPKAWQGLSVDDTAAAVEAYTYATASYLKSKGVKIDVWSPGNEIGTGILNFRPGERLPMPQGASPYDAIDFMEQNVWPIEAQLLKAAISGIRRVDPAAKIVLHIAGLTLSPADGWVNAFFTTMVNLGVPFDVAGLSLPYMTPGWTLPQYTTGCWYQKLDTVFRGFAALGKKGIIAEGAYPNTTLNISANAPMTDFPITPAGQAAWIYAVLRFASNNPNVLGFNYTFPEGYPGVPGLNPPPVDIEAVTLFKSATTVQPGMLKFNPFENTAKTPHIDAIVNLANYQSGPFAPGEYAAAYGENLAGFSLPAQQVPYLPYLSDVSVSVNGQPAPVQYVSGKQVNFLVPYATVPGSASVIVSAGLQNSAPSTIQVASPAPKILVYNGNQAIAQDFPSGDLNGPAAPAPPDSAITVYIVGLGPTLPPITDGAASPANPPAVSAQTVTATIAGQQANVFFAGMTPETVGLGQVNITVPPNLAPGTYPLIITVGSQASSPATLFVGTTTNQ